MIGVSALLRDIQIWMRYQKSSGNLFEKTVFAWNNNTVTWSILNRIQSSPRLSRSWRRRRRSPGGRCTPSWAVDVHLDHYHFNPYSIIRLFHCFFYSLFVLLAWLFLIRKSMYAWADVKPKVGKMMTMNRRYQNVFFMIAWFWPDLEMLVGQKFSLGRICWYLVQWPTSISA